MRLFEHLEGPPAFLGNPVAVAAFGVTHLRHTMPMVAAESTAARFEKSMKSGAQLAVKTRGLRWAVGDCAAHTVLSRRGARLFPERVPHGAPAKRTMHTERERESTLPTLSWSSTASRAASQVRLTI